MQDFFDGLMEKGQYDKDLKPDRIALLFVYVPIIRAEVVSFVHDWNGHKLRKQRNRPHSISGVPKHLYHYSNSPSCGYGIDDAYVDEVLSSVEEWGKKLLYSSNADSEAKFSTDIDEYLPTETWTLCRDTLADLGVLDGRTAPTSFVPRLNMRAHEVAYRGLRRRLHGLEATGLELNETPRPYGGTRWTPEVYDEVVETYNRLRRDPHGAEAAAFAGDGPEPGAVGADFIEDPADISEE